MKKKLLFVMNTMGQAGAEKALVEFFDALDTSDFDVSLYVILNRGEMFSRVSSKVTLLNKKPDSGSVLTFSGRMAIAVRVVASLLRRGWIFRNFSYIRNNIKEQKRVCGKIRPEKIFWRSLSDGAPRFDTEYDLAVAYLEGASTYYVAEHVTAKKKAAFIHTDYVRAGYTPYIDCNCYDKIDRVFVVSKQVGERFLEVYPQHRDRVFLFRNIINSQQIAEKSADLSELDERYAKDDGGVRLVTVGRLCYEKGYDIAIETAAILKSRNIAFRWFILGEGPIRAKLERLIKKRAVEDCFFLLGAKANPYPYIKMANVYVHESRFEGKSVAVDEALALARPIVVSDCDGNRESVTDGVTGIITPLDPVSAADAIMRVLGDSELRASLCENAFAAGAEGSDDISAFYEMMA